jgi:hypothetical protein
MDSKKKKKKKKCLSCNRPHRIFDRQEGIISVYALSSGYSSLRVHLENKHKVEYLRLCREEGWRNQLPTAVKAAKASLAASRSQDPSGRHDVQRQPFSQHTFIQHLINFIVADDQVSCIALSFSCRLLYIFPVYQRHRVSRIPQTPISSATGLGR